jgi:phosphate/sulfate permease
MTFFVVLLTLLFLLAALDLVVGVSNDAVNFLNSAIGSKVAPLRTILIIASIGILIGSVFSEGMMEIARNGIFEPSFFTFDKVMIIFLAVMLTDVILLDVYNTYGLPTSTTVSLIFELLGASLLVGIWFLIEQGKSFSDVQYILNYESAIVIIGGIFLSVFVSFFAGSIIHFITRSIFSFRLKKSLKRYGSVFSGLSLTIIVYFLLIKGVEGTTLVNAQQLSWIKSNTTTLLLGLFIISSVFFELSARYFSLNPLKVIVLAGTFSLAMAFAGNDLVNFVGVAAAGYASFQAWSTSGVAGSDFNMGVLNQPVQTTFWILVGSGLIMIITLWTSSKSKKVTETEVSLGRQEEGEERFQSNSILRQYAQ